MSNGWTIERGLMDGDKRTEREQRETQETAEAKVLK